VMLSYMIQKNLYGMAHGGYWATKEAMLLKVVSKIRIYLQMRQSSNLKLQAWQMLLILK